MPRERLVRLFSPTRAIQIYELVRKRPITSLIDEVSRVVHSQTDGILTLSEAKIYLEDVNIQLAGKHAIMEKAGIPTRLDASALLELRETAQISRLSINEKIMVFELDGGIVGDRWRENSLEHKKIYGQLMIEDGKVRRLEINLEAAELTEKLHQNWEGQSSEGTSDTVHKKFLRAANELGYDIGTWSENPPNGKATLESYRRMKEISEMAFGVGPRVYIPGFPAPHSLASKVQSQGQNISYTNEVTEIETPRPVAFATDPRLVEKFKLCLRERQILQPAKPTPKNTLSTDNPFDALLWTAISSHSDEEIALSRSFEEAHRFPIPEFEAAEFVEVSSAAVGVLGRNLWSNGILQAHHQAGSAVFLRCSHGKIFVKFSLLDSEGIHIPDRHAIVLKEELLIGIRDTSTKMGVAAAKRASIYEQELCLYAKRAQLRCQRSSLATANMAKLLKIPDVDYAIVMERLSHELRLRWDAVAQEVQRLTLRELFHPLVAKFAVPMFEKQLKPSTTKNSEDDDAQLPLRKKD
jgi:hypothetical protein